MPGSARRGPDTDYSVMIQLNGSATRTPSEQEDAVKVQDIMTSPASSIQAKEPIGDAAQAMADYDVGALPVLDGQKLVGIVTDRDIAVRAVAGGIGADRPVRLIMTDDVATCSAETEVSDVLGLMATEQIRRVPVCSDKGELIGIVALADAANSDPDKCEVGEALDDICDPSGLHCQPPLLV